MALAAILPVGVVAAACGGPARGNGDAVDGSAGPYGHPDSVLTWTLAEKRAGFPAYDRIFPTRPIPASERPFPLPRAAEPLAPPTYELGGRAFGLEDFLREADVTGLVVVRDGEVLLERYADGHDARTRWVSYSVAKSVVSLLVGAAIRDGHIGSVDDFVTDYLPVLRGSAWEGVRIRHALRMSSGIAWNEDYADPESDVSQEIHYGSEERLRFLASKPRVAPPGTRWNYSTGEIYLVGSVVRAATGEDLATYLHRRIWAPFGMEADANWMLVEPDGAEYAGCCISAVLRDYARLGLFALSGGVLPDGTRVLPDGWMEESTTPAPNHDGYGYLWWLHEDGSWSARGIFGQLLHVDPELGLVVAMHGLWPEPTSEPRSAHRDAFLAALKEALRAPARTAVP